MISWTFSDKDDSVYAIDKELKATVTNYKNTDLVSVGGTNAKIVSPDPTTEETKATESTTKSNTGNNKGNTDNNKKQHRQQLNQQKAQQRQLKRKQRVQMQQHHMIRQAFLIQVRIQISVRKKDADFKNAKYVSSSK